MPLEIPIRIASDAAAARRCGFTKNHRMVEMFVACSWRTIGFYTERQIAKDAFKPDAERKVRANTAYKSGPITFTSPVPINPQIP